MLAIVPLLVLLAAPPKTVTVAKGESLEQIASRVLGDEEAASELAALNGLSAGATPKTGARLKLPGPEREVALGRIRKTQSLMRDANSEAGRKAAQAQLERAYVALHAARYREAGALAESAASELAHPTTRVSVVVEPDTNESRFEVQSGAVEVSSGGASTIAAAGSAVTASRGTAPKVLSRTQPPMPALSEPAEGAEVEHAALRWSSETTGVRFRVEVARDADFRRRVYSADVDEDAVTPALDAGVFWWRVQTIDAQGVEGIPTPPRSFTLKAPAKPEVNVGNPVFGNQERQ